MGILKHQDVFTHKYITAEIRDASGRLHIRHIKHTIGDFFLTFIDKDLYCFKIKDERMNTYTEFAAKSIRTLWYSTKHYLPISPENNKQLEDVLRLNSLPKVNMTMFGALKLLSNREKKAAKGFKENDNGTITLQEYKGFETHLLKNLVEDVADKPEDYQAQMKNLKTFFDNLAIYQIVTPVREITDFIEDDLIETDPKYLGDVLRTALLMDKELKKVLNTKVDAKKNWVLIGVVVAIIGGIMFMGFTMISNGGTNPFSSLFPQFQTGNSPSGATAPTPGGINGGCSHINDADVFQRYATPEDLNAALAKGDIHLCQLSPAVQKLVKNYHPTATAPAQ